MTVPREHLPVPPDSCYSSDGCQEFVFDVVCEKSAEVELLESTLTGAMVSPWSRRGRAED